MGQRAGKRRFQRAHRIQFIVGNIYACSQTITRRTGLHQQRGDLMPEVIRGRQTGAARAEKPARSTGRAPIHSENSESRRRRLAEYDTARPASPNAATADPRRDGHRPRSASAPPSTDTTGSAHPQARGDFFVPLQRTAQRRHGDIRTQGKARRVARHLLVVTAGFDAPGQGCQRPAVSPNTKLRAALLSAKLICPNNASSNCCRARLWS